MDFVDDVDFVFALGWRNNGTFFEVANIIDAGIAGGIDFNNVEVVVF